MSMLGETLTRVTAWLAVALYFAGTAGESAARRTAASNRLIRWTWTAGCVAQVVHLACAFHFYHHWSHQAAFQHTARATARVVGWEWGAGLYFNYLFTAVWLTDVAWQWLRPSGDAPRPRWVSVALHGFMLFIVINATIVFGQGPARWLGMIGLGVLAVTALLGRNSDRITPSRTDSTSPEDHEQHAKDSDRRGQR